MGIAHMEARLERRPSPHVVLTLGSRDVALDGLDQAYGYALVARVMASRAREAGGKVDLAAAAATFDGGTHPAFEVTPAEAERMSVLVSQLADVGKGK